MKILIVCSGNVENFNFELHHAFVFEQIESVKKNGNVEYDTFFIKGKGIFGYLRNLRKLKIKIREYSPDLVHAHFGLSGLLASLQRIVPVIITFHGSDANNPKLKHIAIITSRLSNYNILVSEKIQKRLKLRRRYSIVPCGINFDLFNPIDINIAREKLNMEAGKKYVLFSSSFSSAVKNVTLALSAIGMLQFNIEFIELKDKSRYQVNTLLNACNLLLLTSISEGSPQIIKEAMACNCPIVATDVGDIKDVINDTEGCYITSFDPSDVANKINLALHFNRRTNGREKIKHFDNNIISKKVFDIYQKMIS